MLKLTLVPSGGDATLNPKDKVTFRKNIVYFETDSRRMNYRAEIQCSLPDWFNTTQTPVKYTWIPPKETPTNDYTEKNGKLQIRSTAKNGVYKCVVKDTKDDKALEDWEETELKFYKSCKSSHSR